MIKWSAYDDIDFINEYFNVVGQIIAHYNCNMSQPEMSPEKLQLIATAKVPAQYKQRWLKWWNMSKDGRQANNFPEQPCATTQLRPWVETASFYAGVSSRYHILDI